MTASVLFVSRSNREHEWCWQLSTNSEVSNGGRGAHNTHRRADTTCNGFLSFVICRESHKYSTARTQTDTSGGLCFRHSAHWICASRVGIPPFPSPLWSQIPSILSVSDGSTGEWRSGEGIFTSSIRMETRKRGRWRIGFFSNKCF